MHSARVASESGGFSPEFDHMTLLVGLKDPWLVDVGFGDSFTEPKPLSYSGPESDNRRIYRITRRPRGRLLSRWNAEKRVRGPQYMFSLLARKLEDFAGRS